MKSIKIIAYDLICSAYLDPLHWQSRKRHHKITISSIQCLPFLYPQNELWKLTGTYCDPSLLWYLCCLSNYDPLKTDDTGTKDNNQTTTQLHRLGPTPKGVLTNNRLNSTPSTFHGLLWQSFHPFSSSSGDHLYENTGVLFDQTGTKNQLAKWTFRFHLHVPRKNVSDPSLSKG